MMLMRGGPLTRMRRVAVLAMLVSVGDAFLLPPHTAACVQLGQLMRGSIAFARPDPAQTVLARPLRTLLRQSEEPLAEGGKLEKAEPPLVATSKYTPEEAEKIGNLVADDEWMGLTVTLFLSAAMPLRCCVAVAVCPVSPCRRVTSTLLSLGLCVFVSAKLSASLLLKIWLGPLMN